jgi:WD40 repeat protein
MPGLGDLFGSQQPRLSRRWKASVEDHVIALAWSPTDKQLAAAMVSGRVAFFDAGTGPVPWLCPDSGKRYGGRFVPGHQMGTMALSWRRDGALLATAGQDGMARLWNPVTGGEVAACEAGARWVEHVAWHPKMDVFATAAGKKLRLWSADGKLLREYPDHAATISDLAWRPVTHEITTATYGGVAVWSTESSEPTGRLEWKGSILKLAWTRDGRRLAHGNQDATVHYWILETGDDLQMSGYATKVREVSWDATGRYLATGGGEVVTVWDCTPPGPAETTPLSFEGHEGAVQALEYQANGALLASGGEDGRVILWRPGKFKKAVAQGRLDAPVSRLAWSPDDRLLVAGTETGGVAVYAVM